MPNIDLGALYGGARQRVTALVSADSVDLETIVPATAAWRVRDVVAQVDHPNDHASGEHL